MVDLIVENPKTSEEYAELLKRDGVTPPLSVSERNTGSIIDAQGNELAVVDPNNMLPDETVNRVAHWFVLAINTCAGFKLADGEDNAGETEGAPEEEFRPGGTDHG